MKTKFILLFTLLLISLVSADDCVVSQTNPGSMTEIFTLSNTTNAHAELLPSGYTYSVWCPSEYSIAENCSVTGATELIGIKEGHVEDYAQGNYEDVICIKKDDETLFECGVTETCGENNFGVISIAPVNGNLPTNAHAAEFNYTAYPLKICCGTDEIIEPPYPCSGEATCESACPTGTQPNGDSCNIDDGTVCCIVDETIPTDFVNITISSSQEEYTQGTPIELTIEIKKMNEDIEKIEVNVNQNPNAESNPIKNSTLDISTETVTSILLVLNTTDMEQGVYTYTAILTNLKDASGTELIDPIPSNNTSNVIITILPDDGTTTNVATPDLNLIMIILIAFSTIFIISKRGKV